jgi:hypothetical protein
MEELEETGHIPFSALHDTAQKTKPLILEELKHLEGCSSCLLKLAEFLRFRDDAESIRNQHNSSHDRIH